MASYNAAACHSLLSNAHALRTRLNAAKLLWLVKVIWVHQKMRLLVISMHNNQALFWPR